jgi:hypothetical protein
MLRHVRNWNHAKIHSSIAYYVIYGSVRKLSIQQMSLRETKGRKVILKDQAG